ncbi:hypothetical protein PIB30_012947 [Stylosanthes scabra]|uniref:Uncharacterized protein n=1 Tax=Stylosanthes scabra TaxID=79078 RepID=A0ABU6Y4Q0_9FABA|nr:hypothetical protein [Stylosanthes scabra]
MLMKIYTPSDPSSPPRQYISCTRQVHPSDFRLRAKEIIFDLTYWNNTVREGGLRGQDEIQHVELDTVLASVIAIWRPSLDDMWRCSELRQVLLPEWLRDVIPVN